MFVTDDAGEEGGKEGGKKEGTEKAALVTPEAANILALAEGSLGETENQGYLIP